LALPSCPVALTQRTAAQRPAVGSLGSAAFAWQQVLPAPVPAPSKVAGYDPALALPGAQHTLNYAGSDAASPCQPWHTPPGLLLLPGLASYGRPTPPSAGGHPFAQQWQQQQVQCPGSVSPSVSTAACLAPVSAADGGSQHTTSALDQQQSEAAAGCELAVSENSSGSRNGGGAAQAGQQASTSGAAAMGAAAAVERVEPGTISGTVRQGLPKHGCALFPATPVVPSASLPGSPVAACAAQGDITPAQSPPLPQPSPPGLAGNSCSTGGSEAGDNSIGGSAAAAGAAACNAAEAVAFGTLPPGTVALGADPSSQPSLAAWVGGSSFLFSQPPSASASGCSAASPSGSTGICAAEQPSPSVHPPSPSVPAEALQGARGGSCPVVPAPGALSPPRPQQQLQLQQQEQAWQPPSATLGPQPPAPMQPAVHHVPTVGGVQHVAAARCIQLDLPGATAPWVPHIAAPSLLPSQLGAWPTPHGSIGSSGGGSGSDSQVAALQQEVVLLRQEVGRHSSTATGRQPCRGLSIRSSCYCRPAP